MAGPTKICVRMQSDGGRLRSTNGTAAQTGRVLMTVAFAVLVLGPQACASARARPAVRVCAGPSVDDNSVAIYRAALGEPIGEGVTTISRTTHPTEVVVLGGRKGPVLPDVPWEALRAVAPRAIQRPDGCVDLPASRQGHCLHGLATFLGIRVTDTVGNLPGRVTLSDVVVAGTWAYFEYSIDSEASFHSTAVLLEQREGAWIPVAREVVELGDYHR